MAIRYEVLIIVGEAVLLVLLLRLRRTFGAYTAAIREAQETGLIVHQQTLQILKEINSSQPSEHATREKSA